MLVMIIVLSILLFIISLWLLIYFGHPDDRWECFAIFCKIIMVTYNSITIQIIGMTLAWAQVLMLPLDVANTR